jgi:hypothetical protein
MIPSPSIEVCPSEDDCATHDIVSDEDLPELVQRLKKWRRDNGLSQKAAIVVMNRHGCDVLFFTLEAWERGRRQPGRLASKAVSDFLDRHPVIKNPPVFRRGPRPKK